MEKIENHYQTSKTIRFGLVQKKKIKKEGYTGKLYRSHSVLKELTDYSIEKVENSLSSTTNQELNSLTFSLSRCLNLISDFCNSWFSIYKRIDQIALDKDYYRLLCKQLGVKDLKIKKELVSLFQLEKDSKDEKQHLLIIKHWENNLLAIDEKFEIANEKLKQFEEAIKINRTDYKPNEVELRKAFLSLFSAVKNIVKPIYSRGIIFPNIETIDESRPENKKIIEFALDYEQKSNLLSLIEQIEVYFKENGGNVPYCRATLNHKTLIKSENTQPKDITREIKKLGLDTIIKENKDWLYYKSSIYMLPTGKNRKQYYRDQLSDEGKGLIERALLFKYMQIPTTIHAAIAQNLSKSIGKTEDEIIKFLSDIGRPKSPAKDYADFDDKNLFNLYDYPIKVAFDFAWETLAKSLYHTEANLPIEKCKQFLSDNFEIKSDNKDLLLYANLLELRNLLATIEYGNPTDKKTFVQKAKELVGKIEWENGKKEIKIGNNGDKNKTNILYWLDNGCKKNCKEFEVAKQQIGLFRGSLKNRQKEYKKVTEKYKNISMEMGKAFASIRDAIISDTVLNKTSHYAMIIEDSNQDKYILIQEYVSKLNEKDKIYQKTDNHYNDFKVYYINSITASAVSKMLGKAEKEKRENYNGDNYTNTTELTKEEKWRKFIEEKYWDYEFGLKLKGKEDIEEIKKEIDSKAYQIVEKYIDKGTLNDLVKDKGCLLFPIINQDLAKEEKTESNQFTKDWNAIFGKNTFWRLTPEFRILYRKPTPNYPISDKGDKRYSRFQMVAHFLCDYIPQTLSYISTREQIENYKDDEKWKQSVKNFHSKMVGKSDDELKLEALQAQFGSIQTSKKDKKKKKEKFYVFGIDRGQKELATLCVIDQDKKIIGDFDIYIRSFNTDTKQWEHRFLEKRHILDLSNLRVETTLVIDGKAKKERVLVDLSEVKVKDKNGVYSKPNKMQVKMQQLAYIRKLQFQMQTNPDYVLAWYAENSDKDSILKNFVDKENGGEKGLVSFYGSAVEELEDTLPLGKIEEMLCEFKKLKDKEKDGENVESEINKLIQLEPVDNLKYGVVANMVGVVAYLLKKFDYNVYISLEDLTKPFKSKVNGGLSGVPITITGENEGKRLDVERYAGLGLYNYFEIQLLKKLFRIQQSNNNIIHLVPSFRAAKNYEGKIDAEGKIKNRFGIVFFVEANATSIVCPNCDATNEDRNNNSKPKNVVRDKKNGNDILICNVCGFDTTKEYAENPLKYIKSGDDNAAYIISTSAVKAYELATAVADNKSK